MPISVSVDLDFSAAHYLPRYVGPCAEMHGHNYRVRLTLEGIPNGTSGMLVDFYDVERVAWELALCKLDHTLVNGTIDNPTAENIAVWIWARLRPSLPQLSELTVWETERYSATVKG